MQTGQILLRILDGVHGGASIALDAKNTRIVGSSMSADIPLVDEGIAEQHARIDLDAHADTVVLTALAEGVLVFGQPLAADSAISLRIGSELGIGPVSMRFCATMAGLAMEDTSIDEAGVAAARRHALKQLNRRAYLMSLGRSVWRSRLARYGVLAVVGMATLGWLAWRPDRPTAADHARAIEHIRTRFPDITIHYSEPTGVTTYAGYVDTHAQLGELRASALAADHGRAIIQVVPMRSRYWTISTSTPA